MDQSKTIELGYLNSGTAAFLAKQLYHCFEKQGWRDFRITKPSEVHAFPNACVPVAGVLEHYRSKGCDFVCEWSQEASYLTHTCMHEPLLASENADLLQKGFVSDRVWRYGDSLEIRDLVDAVIGELLTKAQVEQGVIQSIEWCLNEAMDNVLQHANSGCGFFMSQLTGNGRFSACIFDNGIGIYNSLKGTHRVATPFDAITLALQERVTRDNAIGQGNGLWGLSELVLAGRGQYSISSGGATYINMGDGSVPQAQEGFWYSSEGLGTTLVDFQLDTSAPINISETLNGHTPVALWLEGFESPSGEDYVIDIRGESEGTGTRKAAEKIRNMALNILKEGKRRVVLDFEGVNLISSSYADELVGKIVAEVGFSAFGNLFALSNLSDFNQKILDRSVQQRMAQTYYDEPAPLEED